MKKCRQCSTNKPFKEYYALKSAPDCLNVRCKQCCKVNRSLEAVRKRDKKSKISIRQNYRARQLGLEVGEGVTLAAIYRKDSGICHICTKWVQPKHASPDHEIALKNGGTHSMDNMRLSHLVCNLRKGDRY